MRNKRIHVTTLGCDKNTIDSQLMLGLIEERNYLIQEDPREAEIIIVNTCCFIQEAKEQSIDYILEYVEYKKQGNCEVLIVAGCMAERYHQELSAEIAEIDAFLGVGHFDDIIALLDRFEASGEKTQDQSYLGDIDKPQMTGVGRYIPEGTVSTFVRISEGCDHHCTYCAIPKIRGKYRSRTSQDIFAELRYLESKGIRELILIGQDLAPYGTDREEDYNLPKLLEAIARDFSFRWIRMMYLYPEGITRELLAVVKKYPAICQYFDIPLQHTEDAILKRMGRQMSAARITNLVSLIRATLPQAVLRTSIITGFPGETDADHRALLKSIERLSFDHLGVFRYSQEENTPAAEFEDQISEAVKERRYDEIMMAQQKISLQNKQRFVGQTLEVLIEDLDEGEYRGRFYGDAPDIDGNVFVDSQEQPLAIGSFYPVKIVNALEYDLIGDVENELT